MKLKRKFLFLSGFALIMLIYLIRKHTSGMTYVEGWGGNTSRNVKDYISDKLEAHILPEDFCGKKGAFLLVMVHSKPSNFDERSAIRATWARKRDNVSFYFLLGETRNNPLLQSEVRLESLTFGDIIQERFVDHYNNLTLKSIAMLKLFNHYCANTYKYLIKVDDDVFLNVNLVLRMLSKRSTRRDLLMGKIINDTKPFRDSSSKWFVPYEMYPEKKYPDYLCGPTYLMSTDVAQKLYHCALETPIFYIEDVYVTGICAKKMNLTPQHDSHFTCNVLSRDFCLHRELYALHHFTAEKMRRSYKVLENNECAVRTRWQRIFDFF